jgi:hypothetical protein
VDIVLPYHWRLAELWTLSHARELTAEEQNELTICLQANANFARKLAQLYNCAYAASLVDDKAWQEEIARRIEQIEHDFPIQLPDLKSK